MKKISFSIILTTTLLALVAASGCKPSEVLTGSFAVSPLPREVHPSEADSDPFVLSSNVLICHAQGDEALGSAAELLAEEIRHASGIRLRTRAGETSSPSIVLDIDAGLGAGLSDFQQESCYRICVSEEKITLIGGSVQGVLHGIQTLVKALPLPEDGSSFRPAWPAGEVFDYPEFPYRAFMLDCGRHFFPMETVKKVIDILALHNLNFFHWHLSEDQGWRLEIKKYPKLTETASSRPGTEYQEGQLDGVPVSGFYTQEEAREVVRYAAARGITVIPEIDLPGHTQAMLAAYPELGCTGGPYEVATRYGVLDDVLCVGKESTMDFVKDVLTELLDIFPSGYIHLGGDECPKVRWEECPDCQRKIRELGLKGDGHKTPEELLQSWFSSQLEVFLAGHGRRMICWNDVLCDWSDHVVGAPSKQTVIAAWMRPSSASIAVREGYDAIMCPCGYLYFSNAENNQLTGEESLRKVYDLAVIPEGLTPEERSRIIGAEACIWSERVADEEKLLWELLPRISTLAELQWSDPAAHDLQAYLPRLRHMTRIYDSRGWNWKTDVLDMPQ